MQDTIVDKMLPLFLKQAGEKTGTVIENLNRVERLGFINDVEQWLAARTLRNKLVHEYIEELEEIVGALNLCRTFVGELIKSQNAFAEYVKSKLSG